MALNRDQVFAAAAAIVAEGGKPTQATVRQRLGTGSFTTIGAWLSEWQANQRAATPAPREPIPEVVAGPLMRLGAELWAAALTEAGKRHDAERAAAKAEMARLSAEKEIGRAHV